MRSVSICIAFAFSSLFSAIEQKLGLEESPSVVEYHHFLQQALRDQDWWAVIDYAHIISSHFPESPFAEDTAFFIGESYYKMGQLELANEEFTSYLSHTASPRHFEEALYLKFHIAEQFKSGVKKPLFGSHKLPKIVSGEEDAIAIYEEVISALPYTDIAAQSLLGKAQLQAKLEEYKPSLETLDLLIRRFPKHDLAAQSFLEKGHVYLAQCEGHNLDPALLELAQLNLHKFNLAFPRENRIVEAEKDLKRMQEIYAEQLMETGRFFEKTKKIPASILYYSKVLSQYPSTQAAESARKKLDKLQPPIDAYDQS